MKINPSKWPIWKSCHKTTHINGHITLNDAIIDKVVDDFVFLGSNVPSVVADVKRRTRLAAWAFGRLKNAIWTNQDITRSLKVRIYRALILPIAIYGAESWTLRQADKCQLDTFEMRCLRVILGVSLMDKIRNEEIRRLKWFGHVVRMPTHRLPFQAYKNDFLKRRPPGRPPARWRDQIERDMGVPLKEAEHQAQGRPEWRRITRRRAKGHTVLYAVKSSKSQYFLQCIRLFSYVIVNCEFLVFWKLQINLNLNLNSTLTHRHRHIYIDRQTVTHICTHSHPSSHYWGKTCNIVLLFYFFLPGTEQINSYHSIIRWFGWLQICYSSCKFKQSNMIFSPFSYSNLSANIQLYNVPIYLRLIPASRWTN